MSPLTIALFAESALAQGWSRSDLGNEQSMVSLATGDLDGDGDPDLVAVSTLQSRILAFENRGGRRFGPGVVAVNGVTGTSVQVGDFDGDGVPDLTYAAGWVYVARGDGAFGFTRTATSPSSALAWPRGLSTGDLDGDGDLDIAFAELGTSRFTWWENLGGGVMGPLWPVDRSARGADATALADLDADGDLDLLGALEREIAAYPNAGDGTFGARRTLATGAGACSVRASDLDGDGDPDVIGSFMNTMELALLWNDGAGLFARERVVVAAPYDADAADLDRDGDLDLVYSSGNEGRVAWIERTGATWGPERNVGVTNYGEELALADFDLDGAPDVAVVNRYPETLTVFWNNLPADADGDGVRDEDDVCPGEDDTLDTDGDGLPDGCDPCPLGGDTDGDGACDAGDPCPLDPPPHDDDGDLVCDADDLCPGAPDADDEDGDRQPDACDPCPALAAEVDADADGSWACDDCDDARPDVRPDAAETPADGVDADCDGLEACWADGDGDGFGDGAAPSSDLTCAGAGLSPWPGDCDDGAAGVHPGAWDEAGSGADEDCDGLAWCWSDGDGDGSGTAVPVLGVDETCAGEGIAPTADDCAGDDPARHPGAEEVPLDGVDQDCDGAEACPVDADGDGFGGPDLAPSAALACSAPGFATDSADCDDLDPAAHPGAAEVCDDGVDQDCDGADLALQACSAQPEPEPEPGGRVCGTAPGRASWLGALLLLLLPPRRQRSPCSV